MKNPPSPEKLGLIAETLDMDGDGVLSMDVLRKTMSLVESEGRDITPEALEVLVQLAETEGQLDEKQKKKMESEQKEKPADQMA